MKNIRRKVFETNSSSSHSITIDQSNKLLDTLEGIDGEVTIYPGDFGWEVENYYDAYTKAQYCMIFARDWSGNFSSKQCLFDMLEQVIKEQTGARKVNFEIGTPDKHGEYEINNGYIDHQSGDVAEEAFKNKETLRNFIFNPKSILRTDNDNK